MVKWSSRLLLVVVIVALVASTGCVTKKVFRKNVEDTESRISGVESAVEANERRIEDLGDATDKRISEIAGTAEKAVEIGNTAVAKAEAAQMAADNAAKGKLLWEVTLSDDSVRFSFDQAQIPPEAAAQLDDLAAKAKSFGKAVYVEIEGHTDNIGSEEYNLQLGEKRAMAVRNYLNEKGGLPLHAISTISYGESRPVGDNGTPEGRAQNRRVVVRVLE